MPISPAVRSARILIVDDCCDTGGVLCELLTWMGYENVSSTTDGKALLSVDSANHYGLILLDMHMPSLGGLEIMRHLRNKQTESCVPVIAISGDQRYGTVVMAAGACAFLIKPFNQGELEATIYSALSKPDERLA
jgi:DNA-binding response OmpR family regulator